MDGKVQKRIKITFLLGGVIKIMKGKKGKAGLNLSGGFLLRERGRTDCLICRMKKEEFKKKGWNEEEET
jgi:hypothetical protein